MKPLFLLILLGSLFMGCQQTASKMRAPESISYLTREAWGAKPPVLPMRSHTLRRITIHHTGVKQAPERSLREKMQALQQFSQQDSPLEDGRIKAAWADVPYHLYVDYYGEVAEGRSIDYAGDSNTPYDPAGHLLVVVEGTFDTEALNAQQLKALEVLIPALAKRYRIPADSIGGHKDFAQTSCPGKALYEQLPYLKRLVAGQ